MSIIVFHLLYVLMIKRLQTTIKKLLRSDVSCGTWLIATWDLKKGYGCDMCHVLGGSSLHGRQLKWFILHVHKTTVNILSTF